MKYFVRSKTKNVRNLIRLSSVLKHATFLLLLMHFSCGKKGKAVPLQAWTGPEDSRMLRLPEFKTFGT